MTRHSRRLARRRLLIGLGCGICIAAAGLAAWRFSSGRQSLAREHLTPGVTRLDKPAIARLLNAAGHDALTFEPYQGNVRCCDLGDPTLHLHADGTAVIDANGFVLDERAVSFTITEEGTLQWRDIDPSLAGWLQHHDLQSADWYWQGSELYLVRAGSGPPKLPLKHMNQWPFRAARRVL